MKTLIPCIAIALTLAPAPAHAAEVVDIAVTPDGFSAPARVQAGQLTLRVRSTDPAGAWLGVVRLRDGVPLDRYLADVRQAFSSDPAQEVAGGRAVTADAVMLGGVAVANTPAAVTMSVNRGRYLLIDFRDALLPDLATRVRTLDVQPRPDAPACAATRITLLENRFAAPSSFASGAPVEVVNRSSQFNEAMLIPVRPGTTLADLDAFFAVVNAGQGYPPTSPFVGGPTGVVPLSPGRSAIFAAALPAGPYALVTWIRDLRTGQLYATQGMRTLVTLS